MPTLPTKPLSHLKKYTGLHWSSRYPEFTLLSVLLRLFWVGSSAIIRVGLPGPHRGPTSASSSSPSLKSLSSPTTTNMIIIINSTIANHYDGPSNSWQTTHVAASNTVDQPWPCLAQLCCCSWESRGPTGTSKVPTICITTTSTYNTNTRDVVLCVVLLLRSSTWAHRDQNATSWSARNALLKSHSIVPDPRRLVHFHRLIISQTLVKSYNWSSEKTEGHLKRPLLIQTKLHKIRFLLRSTGVRIKPSRVTE